MRLAKKQTHLPPGKGEGEGDWMFNNLIFSGVFDPVHIH